MNVRSSKSLIGKFVSEALDGWCAPAHDAAALSFVDTLASAFASGTAGVNGKVRLAFDRRISKAGEAEIWLSAEASDCEGAAFLNAVAAHALDYDDVAPAWRGHPGAVIFPALASLRSQVGAAGRNLLNAYVVGFEVGAALGKSIIKTHYPLGWHSTATIGTIAATAACCRYLGVSEQIASHAVGIAVAQAAGVRSNFGTEAKPLQAGFAASAAVRSCLIAAAGVDSGEETIDGPFGFLDLYSGNADFDARPFEVLGQNSPTLARSHEIKLYPTCYATHRAIAATIDIRRTEKFPISEIERISVESSPGSHDALRSAAPKNGDEAKFHMPTVLAMSLVDGQVGLRSFDTGRFADEEIQALAGKVHVSEVSGSERLPRWSRVSIAAGGRKFDRLMQDLPPVTRALPAFLDKVSDCLAVAGGAARARFDAVVEKYIGAEFSISSIN